MKFSHQNVFFFATWMSLLLSLCLVSFAACGDDDDDNDEENNDDDNAGECTEQIVCERHYACGMVQSVNDCLTNMDTCPDPEGFVDCLCTCHGQDPDCSVVEPCFSQCIGEFCQAG